MGPGDAPDVSVCVTTYQHARFIERCMESVLSQSFGGTLELIVGDDGSTDGTRELIADLAARDSRVKPVFHSRNLGPAGNLNSLVAMARGNNIAHLDGDDAWENGKLAAQLEVLDADPAVVAVYCNAWVVTPDDACLGLFNGAVPPRIDFKELLRRGNFLNHSSLLYRAGVVDAVLGMCEPWVDYRLHIRLASHGDLAYVNAPLVVHRWRTSGSMINTMPRAVIDGQLDAFSQAIGDGADLVEVRNAAGRVWGKALMQGLIFRDFSSLRYFTRRLRALPGIRAGFPWFAKHVVLSPIQALHSWISRRRGIFFP